MLRSLCCSSRCRRPPPARTRPTPGCSAMPAVGRQEHRLRLRRRPVGRRPRRQEPPPAHQRHRRRVATRSSRPTARRIAFSAQYDGNTDVYTIPVAGGVADAADLAPRPGHRPRLHPGRQGGPVLLAAARLQRTGTSSSSPCRSTGGMPTQLPIPWGFEAAYSPDGEYIAYTPGPRRHRPVEALPRRHPLAHLGLPRQGPRGRSRSRSRRTAATTSTRSWVGNTRLLPLRPHRRVQRVRLRRRRRRRSSRSRKFTDFPVLDINAGGGKLIFEQAGYLHLLDPGRVAAAAAEDRRRHRPRRGPAAVRQGGEVRPRRERLAERARAWPSSSAARSSPCPAEKGDPRNLTNTPGVHERDPAWSPGRQDDRLLLRRGRRVPTRPRPAGRQGRGRRRSSSTAPASTPNPVWSRDSKKIALPRQLAVALLARRRERARSRKIVEPKYGLGRGLKLSSWSPDSKWVTYAMDTPAQIGRVYVYSLEQDKSFPVTDGLSEATEPVFDAGGKYLYFLGSTDTGMSKHGFSQSAARQPAAAVVAQPRGAEEGPAVAVPARERRGEGRARGEPHGREGGDGAEGRGPTKKDGDVHDRLRRARPAHPVVPAAAGQLRRPAGRLGGAGLLPGPVRDRRGRRRPRRRRRRRRRRRSSATTSTGGATRPCRPASALRADAGRPEDALLDRRRQLVHRLDRPAAAAARHRPRPAAAAGRGRGAGRPPAPAPPPAATAATAS